MKNGKSLALPLFALLLLMGACAPASISAPINPKQVVSTNVAATIQALPTFTFTPSPLYTATPWPSTTPRATLALDFLGTATLPPSITPAASPVYALTETAVIFLTPLPVTDTPIARTVTPASGGGAGSDKPRRPRYSCEVIAYSPLLATSRKAGTVYTMSWLVKNTGEVPWDVHTVDLLFEKGQILPVDDDGIVDIPASVNIGSSIELKVEMRLPSAPGMYSGYWTLKHGAPEDKFCLLETTIRAVR